MTEERRLVTVMFADVVGSTALGEQLDPEDVRSMMREYYAISRDVVADFGGTIEKFIGDAVMGVFGIPNAHDDDAARAMSAAIELRERVRNTPTLVDVQLRFGICTGEVVATREPGADFLITGEAVNTAARLQQAAEPWAILAAERTVRAALTGFDLGPRLEVAAKGKSALISARLVIAKRDGDQPPESPRAPMRGRDDELEQLIVIARRVFRDRRPACVTVIAPAGTGKTRLVDEFLTHELPAIAPDAERLVAQCLPYGKQMTYWPLRQVLFKLAGLDEDLGPNAIRAGIEAWIGNARHSDQLAASIGYGSGEPPDRADVLAAWRNAFEKASSARPLALVFEDLHWSSESLLDLVDFVMQARGDAPILMLAISRPELMDRRPGWGGGRRNFTNLFLEPLGDEAMGELVRDLLSGFGDDAVASVVVRAGGNPFYAGELARTVTAEGQIEALPDTVQASIQARLDLLPADERRVLQIGSIFGRTFRLSGVMAIAPELERVIAPASDALLAREFVNRDDEDHMTFAHILIREVAYNALTRAERAHYHGAAGMWLESRSEGREAAVAEMVAFHYRESLSMLGRQGLPGLERSEIQRLAVRWLTLAGNAAAAAGAEIEASRHFQEAIKVAPEEALPELYERLGDVSQLRVGSVDAYGKALDLGRKAGRPAEFELRVLGGFLMCTLRWAEGVGRFPLSDLQAMIDTGRKLAAGVTDQRALARFLAAESFYPYHQRREGVNPTDESLDAAEASGLRAMVMAEQVRDWQTWSAAVDVVTSVLIERHDWARARDMARLRVARQLDLSAVERMDAYHMVWLSSFHMGDLETAERSTAEAMELLDYVQHPTIIMLALADRMQVLLLLGRWDEVVDSGDRLLHFYRLAQEGAGPTDVAFIMGLTVARARRDAARMGHYEEAISRLPTHSRALYMIYAEGNSEEMERALSEHVRSGYLQAQIIERIISELTDRRYALSGSTLDLASSRATEWRMPLAEAEVKRARGDFDGAAEIWTKAGAVPYAARARIDKALASGIDPDPAAVDVLRRLGDVEYLESHELGVTAR